MSKKLHQPKIEIPTPGFKTLSRGILPTQTPRYMKATMPKGAKPASLSASREFSSLPQKNKISLCRLADDLLNGTSFSRVESPSVPQLTIIIKEKKRRFILQADYASAEKCDKLIGSLNTLVINRKYAKIQSKNVQELQSEIQSAQSVLNQIQIKWNQKIDQFNEKQEQACRSLESEQQSRIEAFDSLIPSELPANYCKLSPEILDLREKERHLVLTKRYSEALSLQSYTDTLEKAETIRRKEQFIRATQSQRNKLTKKQTYQVQCFVQKWNRQAEQLKQERSSEILNQERIIKNLKIKLDSAKSEHYENL